MVKFLDVKCNVFLLKTVAYGCSELLLVKEKLSMNPLKLNPNYSEGFDGLKKFLDSFATTIEETSCNLGTRISYNKRAEAHSIRCLILRNSYVFVFHFG